MRHPKASRTSFAGIAILVGPLGVGFYAVLKDGPCPLAAARAIALSATEAASMTADPPQMTPSEFKAARMAVEKLASEQKLELLG